MIEKKEQLVDRILDILGEETYKEQVERICAHQVRAIAYDIADRFLDLKLSSEDIRKEIDTYLMDYFDLDVEHFEEKMEEIRQQDAKPVYSIYSELAQNYNALILRVPVSDQWKEEISRTVSGIVYFGMEQSMERDCVVQALYDILPVEKANVVMNRAIAMINSMTDAKMKEMQTPPEEPNIVPFPKKS